MEHIDTPEMIEPDMRLGMIGLDNFAPYLMNRIMGRYNAALHDEMLALGLTTPQMRALAVLSVMDGILIRELSVYAVVEQSTLSRALDKLEKEGLTRREVAPNDSRATLIYLTKEGRGLYEQLWPHVAAAYEQMFTGIDAEEQRVFVGTLQRILRNVRKHNF